MTGHTLWMLMGVAVDTIDQKFDADLELLPKIDPTPSAAPLRPKWAYVMGPEVTELEQRLAGQNQIAVERHGQHVIRSGKP